MDVASEFIPILIGICKSFGWIELRRKEAVRGVTRILFSNSQKQYQLVIRILSMDCYLMISAWKEKSFVTLYETSVAYCLNIDTNIFDLEAFQKLQSQLSDLLN